MTVRFSQKVYLQGAESGIHVSVDIDPYDDAALVRGITELRKAAALFEEHCDGCLTPYPKLHMPDCPYAPVDLIARAWFEMEEALKA